MLKRRQRLLQERGRLPVGGARERACRGLAEVCDRLRPHVTAERVMRQSLDVLRKAIGVECLDRGDDT